MRALERNKASFYYCLFVEETKVMDEDNLFTGEYAKTYSEPVQMKANISPANGTTLTDQFGTNIICDKVIVTADIDCPIDENSILFVDKEVSSDKESGQYEYDYVVKKVAKSINSISIAISKVKTDEDRS